MDKATGTGICVIDLDTVMPGLALNDYGDSIRFGGKPQRRDEKDLSKVNFDIELYEIYTKGFMEAAGDALTPAEKEYLPWGAKLMTLECGIRSSPTISRVTTISAYTAKAKTSTAAAPSSSWSATWKIAGMR